MSAAPVPGSISGRARSVFEEGLRLPVIRIVRAGELDTDLLTATRATRTSARWT